MFVFQNLRFSLDNPTCRIHFPELSCSAIKPVAENLLKAFGLLLAGYIALSIASYTIKNLDQDTVIIGGVILAYIASIALTFILTVSIINKFHEKKMREINAFIFEYETLEKQWQVYKQESDEYSIDLQKCLEQQDEVRLKQKKVIALQITAKIALDEGRFYNTEKMVQEISVVEELNQRNNQLVNDLLVVREALEEKYQQLIEWQSRLDKWHEKTNK